MIFYRSNCSNGFISIGLALIIVTLTSLFGIISILMTKNNRLLLNYQVYIQHYYAADAALKLALNQLKKLKHINDLDKSWCYENASQGFPIIPFGTHTIFLWRVKNDVIAISLSSENDNRVILLGDLNQNETGYNRIYALDSDQYQ